MFTELSKTYSSAFNKMADLALITTWISSRLLVVLSQGTWVLLHYSSWAGGSELLGSCCIATGIIVLQTLSSMFTWIYMTGFEKKPGFHLHKIKLTSSPEMDFWSNLLSYSTVCLAQKLWAWFLWQTGSTSCVVLCHHWLVMALLEWCLEGLAGVFLFWMLWAHVRSSKILGFQSSLYILYFYIEPTPYPLPLLLPRATLLPSQKAAQNS